MLDLRFVRFVIVGLANSFVGLLVIYGCKWFLDMGDIPANAIGYGIGIMLGFQLNKRWTFGHNGVFLSTFLRYILVLAFAYAVNLTVVLYGIEQLNLNSYLAQALGIVPYTLVGYLGSHFFVFNKINLEAK